MLINVVHEMDKGQANPAQTATACFNETNVLCMNRIPLVDIIAMLFMKLTPPRWRNFPKFVMLLNVASLS